MKLEQQIIRSLVRKGLRLAIAESCTGGLLSSRLTDIPGASQCFLAGIVCYSDTSKIKLLKVPGSIIKTQGAVSRQVACCLAKNVRKLQHADIGIGITGIAGPAGGSKAKSVGLVYIALSSRRKNIYKKFNFPGSRLEIRQQAVNQALSLLKQIIK